MTNIVPFPDRMPDKFDIEVKAAGDLPLIIRLVPNSQAESLRAAGRFPAACFADVMVGEIQVARLAVEGSPFFQIAGDLDAYGMPFSHLDYVVQINDLTFAVSGTEAIRLATEDLFTAVDPRDD
jgi:hypothetical protein